MQPPFLILCDDGEVLLLGSADVASTAMEAADVEAKCYPKAFDSTGCRVDVVVRPPRDGFPKAFGRQVIGLTQVEVTPTGAEELRALLRDRLGDAGAKRTLSDLVQAAAEATNKPRPRKLIGNRSPYCIPRQARRH
ncbi:MAG: hypothetical protein HY904_18985 [Deltaproteobacteria bacterium]|nr:hypothetical protein [Deltaproteobacteria bacterium]